MFGAMRQTLDGSAGEERLERIENLYGGVGIGELSSSYRGGPRYLMQGDLLSALGPMLTVRGDSFIIRSYGESRSAVNASQASRAYLEITVQRVAEPVENIAEGALIRADGNFGRRFQITGMRWILPDEV